MALVIPAQGGLEGLRYGAFICWTTSTFSSKQNADPEPDWPSEAELTPVQFAPPDYTEEQLREKTDAWARVAVNAGMTHILLLTKHMDGLCLWDTSYPPDSPFKVTSPLRAEANPPILHRDVVKAVSESCAKFGLRLALYYCLRDKQNGFDPELVKNHLEELLTRYGPVEYLWLDVGYGAPLGDELKLELAYFVKNAPPLGIGHPDTAVGFNGGGGIHDFLAGEYAQPGPNPLRRIREFCFPIESGLRFRGQARWHYTVGEDGKCMSAEDVWDYHEAACELGNLFDLNIGPDRRGDFRAIDVDCLQRAGRLILVNDDDGPTYGGPGEWNRELARGRGDFGDDAHFTSSSGAYCEYSFMGTGIDVIAGKGPGLGTMKVLLDGVQWTNLIELRSLFPEGLVRQTVFSVASLAPGPHTIRLENAGPGRVGVDAFRVHPMVETGPAVPVRLSVASDGAVWVVDDRHRIWKSNLPNANPVSSWARILGTARDIGCGGGRGSKARIWKIGTGPLDRDRWPLDFTVTFLEPQGFHGDRRWANIPGSFPGAATRLDVAADGAVWTINSSGLISRFGDGGWQQIPGWFAAPATDIGCPPVDGNFAVAKVGSGGPFLPADYGTAVWTGSAWEPKPRPGVAVDMAANGDLWLVTTDGELWRYRASLEPSPWAFKGQGVRDIACGADGSVWRAGYDNQVRRLPREGRERMDVIATPAASGR